MAKQIKLTGWKNVALIAAVSVAVFGGIFFWLSWQGSPKEIVGIADQFKADSSWELKFDTVIPPRTICIDSVCPSVARTWRLSEPITSKDGFNKLAQISGKKFTVDDDCFNSNNFNSSCSAHMVLDGYTATLSYSLRNDEPFIVLRVTK